MVASKQKKPKHKEAPKTQKNAAIANSPEQYYGENPSWRFSTIDIKMWSLVNDSVQKIFWNEILPKLHRIANKKYTFVIPVRWRTGKTEV